jgi:hypothetical protein
MDEEDKDKSREFQISLDLVGSGLVAHSGVGSSRERALNKKQKKQRQSFFFSGKILGFI